VATGATTQSSIISNQSVNYNNNTSTTGITTENSNIGVVRPQQQGHLV
jgi:hypothetical protein